jgi:hypothetical protein
MPLHTTLVPPASGGSMTTGYLEDFMNTTVTAASGTLIQVLDASGRLLLVWSD